MATLMSLPAEVRIQIWHHVTPKEVEFDVINREHPDYLRYDSNGAFNPIPQNPALPFLLLCHQARTDVMNIARPLLIAYMSYWSYDLWLQNSSARYRKPFSVIRIRVVKFYADRSYTPPTEDSAWFGSMKEFFKHYWREVEGYFHSDWTFREDAALFDPYTVEAVVEMRVSGVLDGSTAPRNRPEHYQDW